MRGERVDTSVVPAGLVARILQRLAAPMAARRPVRVGIAGESGSGKTVLAHALQEAVHAGGQRALVIQLDDYFRLPPRDNEARRRADMSWVGPGEVDCDRLDRDLARVADGARQLVKPLVDYPANVILEETLDLTNLGDLAELGMVLVEGTYVGMLRNIDLLIFIDRSYHDTREARRARGREAQDEWLEAVLAIEHGHIRGYRDRADMVIDRNYQLREDEQRRT